ncbi:MAG: hypothetical protein EPN92_08210 [Chitinophagaceae bacterium]|nr:MAG: hypothetical protein EPN92_08210 [Chitinophagaceae bacterium]
MKKAFTILLSLIMVPAFVVTTATPSLVGNVCQLIVFPGKMNSNFIAPEKSTGIVYTLLQGDNINIYSLAGIQLPVSNSIYGEYRPFLKNSNGEAILVHLFYRVPTIQKIFQPLNAAVGRPIAGIVLQPEIKNELFINKNKTTV